MGVYKRGKIYHFKFDWKGDTYRATCKTSNKAQAQEFEQRYRDDLILSEKQGESITVQQSLDQYIDSIRGAKQKQNSIKREESVCNRLVGKKLHKRPVKTRGKSSATTLPYVEVAGIPADTPIHHIDFAVIDDLKNAWTKEGLKPDSQRQCIGALRRALNLSERRGHRPCRLDFTQFKFKKSIIKKRYFSIEEERAFLEQLKLSKEPNNYHLAVFLFDTGARISEALNLTFKQLNDRTKKIELRRFKTEDENVHTTILDYTDRLAISIKYLRKTKNPDSPYVFRDKDNLGPKKYSDRWFNEACKRANLGPTEIDSTIEKFSIHSCRRTYASRLLILKMTLKQVSVLLGHSNTLITESRYGHLVSEDANREASKLMNQFHKDPAVLKIQESSFVNEPDPSRPIEGDLVFTNPSQTQK